MPSWELFEEQTAAYRDTVLPPAVTARLRSRPASSRVGSAIWAAWAFPGDDGFGASAPYGALAKHFGFTTENVVKLAHGGPRAR